MRIEALSAAMRRIAKKAASDCPDRCLVPFFGPPVEQCDLLIVSTEPGGEDPKNYLPWPSTLLYANRPENPDKGEYFGPNLRSYMARAGLVQLNGRSQAVGGILYDRTMAMPTNPISMRYGDVEVDVRRMGRRQCGLAAIGEIVDLAQPKVILVTGPDNMNELVKKRHWTNEEKRANGRYPATVYAEAAYRGRPAVLCKHLSVIGGAHDCLVKSMQRVREIIDNGGVS